MPSGVKRKDIVVGTGEEAVRPKTVVVSLRMFLNRGGALPERGAERRIIDLGRRACMAGLRYGIEGMRVGGRRELKISPHLVYGAEGVPGAIPPHAAIRCEVELLEVRDPGVRLPDDFPPGKTLHVISYGDPKGGAPCFQLGLSEDGVCGGHVIDVSPGTPARRAGEVVETCLDEALTRELFENAASMPKLFPGDCLGDDEVPAATEEARVAKCEDAYDPLSRDYVSVIERGQRILAYSVGTSSRARRESRLFKFIDALVEKRS